VNLLLDAHTLLWFLDDDPLLSGKAKKLIEHPSNHKFVSVATCWEIAIKVGLKRLNLGEPATTFLPRELTANHFDLLKIELRTPRSWRCYGPITKTHSTASWSPSRSSR
jgi:PIN domain nuclease of toxin-antitoxin system